MIHSINLGGGPGFSYPGWLNMEAVASELNPHPTVLDGHTVFPFPDASIKLVYTSHALEHLDDAAVNRAFAETRRCLERDGDFVIKIPDFEAALAAWRNNDAMFFSTENWNVDAVTWSWPSRGLRDTLTNRASLLFCGFWNDEFGSPFAGIINRTPTAYFGPVVCAENEVEQLFSLNSPKEITRILVSRVKEAETGFTFTHQNAWGVQEMADLLNENGFVLIGHDKETICGEFSEVPGIRQMFDVSLYVHAKPV